MSKHEPEAGVCVNAKARLARRRQEAVAGCEHCLSHSKQIQPQAFAFERRQRHERGGGRGLGLHGEGVSLAAEGMAAGAGKVVVEKVESWRTGWD